MHVCFLIDVHTSLCHCYLRKSGIIEEAWLFPCRKAPNSGNVVFVSNTSYSLFNCLALDAGIRLWLSSSSFGVHKHTKHLISTCERPYKNLSNRSTIDTVTVYLLRICGCWCLWGSNWVICHGFRAPTSHGICGMQMKFRLVDSRQGRSGFLMDSLEYKGILWKYEKLKNAFENVFSRSGSEQRSPVFFTTIGCKWAE